ncbi:hypothetical protein GCM10020254_79320 [Streptomyces goshikiensis]
MDSDQEMDPARQGSGRRRREHGACSGCAFEGAGNHGAGSGPPLYGFHQLTGTADFELGEAVRLLREAGYEEQAALIEREIVGRNVIPGHWMFQIIEAYNSTYYQPFAAVERDIVDEVAGGRDHLMEARLKTIRRTPHHPDHTATPLLKKARLGEGTGEAYRN